MLANVTDATAAGRPVLPQIRVSHTTDGVPACVTPEPAHAPRHGAHARSRAALPRHRPLLQAARRGARHPLGLRLLPDAARDQLPRPTGRGRRQPGRRAIPRQNNFAGIGTTGGGVPGDSFPDVSTGVLAQMQHLVAYSGEHVRQSGWRRARARSRTTSSRCRGAAAAGALRRPHQPLGQGPQLRQVDRVGRRPLPPGQLHADRRAAAAPATTRPRPAATAPAWRASRLRLPATAPSGRPRPRAPAPATS